MRKKLSIKDNLIDWRQRLHHTHPDFRPGFIYVDGIAGVYVDTDGSETFTIEYLTYLSEQEDYGDED
jgi:hypothetical protein